MFCLIRRSVSCPRMTSTRGPWRTISASRRALCQPVTRRGSHPPIRSGSRKKAHKR
jgi:hypothetical protein